MNGGEGISDKEKCYVYFCALVNEEIFFYSHLQKRTKSTVKTILIKNLLDLKRRFRSELTQYLNSNHNNRNRPISTDFKGMKTEPYKLQLRRLIESSNKDLCKKIKNYEYKNLERYRYQLSEQYDSKVRELLLRQRFELMQLLTKFDELLVN